jgi:hypothetical protein
MRRLHLKRLLGILMCAGLFGLTASPAPTLAKPIRHAAARHGHMHRLAAGAVGRHHPKVIRAGLSRLAMRVLPAPDRQAHAYASCGDAPERFVRAADVNARSLDDLDWAPFGQPEKGWQVYDLLVGREIGAVCGSGTPVFAEKLAAFQAQYQLPADGVFTPATFEVVKGLLQERRPFVMARLAKVCPDAPSEPELVPVPKPAETFEREDRMIRADVFAAYQRMVAAARAELPSLKDDPKALTIFSAYRSPASDAARCGEQGNCDGLRRAACSSHRTGTAIDINVGWIAGVAADSTAPENRLLQTRTASYRWLVMNAARFGFVNYPYEPWHWEWIGAPGKPALRPLPPPALGPAETTAAAAPAQIITAAPAPPVGSPATPPAQQAQTPH